MSATSASPREPLLRTGVGLIVCAAVGLLIYSLVKPNHKATCEAHLRQIALALQNYNAEHGSFPPAYTLGPDGKPWHSWRVLILPQLGEEKLYKEYRFEEPWDSEHNRKLISRMPNVFGCPASRRAAGTTQYLAVVGERTAWPGPTTIYVRGFQRKGAEHTLQLLEAGASDVVWTEPRDLSIRAALEVFESGLVHRHIAMCDGSVKTLSPTVTQEAFLSALSTGSRHSMGPIDRLPQWLRGKPPAGVADWGRAKEASELESTEIVGASSLPLNAQKSQIWCATFQLAWDKQRERCGGQKVDLQPATPLSDALNNHPFPRGALSPSAILIDAAPTGRESDNRLRAELAERFPNAGFKIEDSNENPDMVRIVAYLEKRLSFFDSFERLSRPLKFGKEKVNVESFGILGSESHDNVKPMLEDLVSIRDYASGQEFVIELATNSEAKDTIILARVPPEATLHETWSRVVQRIKLPSRQHDRPHLMTDETFQLPVLDLNLQRSYAELYASKIKGCAVLSNEARIVKAEQKIRLRLDEQGAILLSMAEVITLDNGHTPRNFIFDQPFLIAMREGKNEPYFLAWIATAEVMEKKTQ